MKNIFYTLGFGLLLASCGGEPETIDSTDSTTTDTTVMMESVDVDNALLQSHFHVKSQLPFILDDSLLSKKYESTEDSALTREEVLYLAFNFQPSDISYSGDSYIADYLFFDSLKTIGEYEDFIEMLDIGMMKSADAYALSELTIDENFSVMLWYINFSTYEACPYSSGTILYATVLDHGLVASSTVIGEDSGGADAPYWGTTVSVCSLTADKMTVTKTDENGGEEDENGNDIVSTSVSTFELEIDKNGVWVINNLSPESF